MARSALTTESRMPSSVSMSIGACELEWLPIRWPASAMRLASPGLAAAHRPWMKNVARAPALDRASSIDPGLDGAAGWSGCSVSIVNATRSLLTGGHLPGEGELARRQPARARQPPGQKLCGHGGRG